MKKYQKSSGKVPVPNDIGLVGHTNWTKGFNVYSVSVSLFMYVYTELFLLLLADR